MDRLREHVPGPKVTSGLFVHRAVVAPTTNAVQVKVISNEAGLRLLCCEMCFPFIYLFKYIKTNHHK